MSELLELIEAQQRDARYGDRIPERALIILGGLVPWTIKAGKPRYFLSGRKVKRRRRRADVPHGTTAMYKRGCRCDSCRSEQSQRNKAWRAQRKVLGGGPNAFGPGPEVSE